MIGDKIPGNHEIREFFFPRDLNHFCVGCYQCIEYEKACPYYEEKKIILDAIKDADVLIVTTPTYCSHVSAPLKAFIDLTFDYWMSHRPRKCMFSKRVMIVSTSAGSSPKSAMKEVMRFAENALGILCRYKKIRQVVTSPGRESDKRMNTPVRRLCEKPEFDYRGK